MGKKILALGMVVCLVAGFVGCSRRFEAVWQWNSSKHDYYAFNVDEKGGFSVIYDNGSTFRDDIYVSRYDVYGNLSWDKKFENAKLVNGVYVVDNGHSSTLVDYYSGKNIVTVDGTLLENELDGKSLLFETTSKNKTGVTEHILFKTDLKGNRLWETVIPSNNDVVINSFDGKLIWVDDYESNSISSTCYPEERTTYNISENNSESLKTIDNRTGLPSFDSGLVYNEKTEITYNFYQIDNATGKLVHHSQCLSNDKIKITDIVDGKWNLLISKPGLLEMYNCIEGKVNWSTKLDVKGIVTVAPRDGIAIIDLDSSDKNCLLACINLINGQEMWRKNVEQYLPENASIVKDKIVIGFENEINKGANSLPETVNKVICYDIATGKTLWTKEGKLFNADGTKIFFSEMPWNWKPDLCVYLNINLDNSDNNPPKNENRYLTSYIDSSIKDPTISGKYVAIQHSKDKQTIVTVIDTDTDTGTQVCQIINPADDYLEYFNIDKDIITVVTDSGMSKYSLANGRKKIQTKFDINKIGMSGDKIGMNGVKKIDLSKDLNDQISNAGSPAPSVKDGFVFVQGCKGLAIYDLNIFDEVYFSHGRIIDTFDVINGDIYLFDSHSLVKLTRSDLRTSPAN
jgi:hypothetical protein